MPECVTPWTTYLAVGIVVLGQAVMIALAAWMVKLRRDVERSGENSLREMREMMGCRRRCGQ